MKNILLFIAWAIFLACNAPVSEGSSASDSSTVASNADSIPSAPAPAKDTTTLAGQWFLMPALPADTAAGRIPRLEFNTTGMKFTGNSGCNSMSGSFELTDSSLNFSERILLTKMACPGYNEEAFIKSLLRTNRYRFENGMLILMFDQTELSRWTRKPVKLPVSNSA
jgi:heat shock protein HslJ